MMMNFFDKFLTIFFDLFDEFLTNVLTYNLLTIASFRIGVPSILFTLKKQMVKLSKVQKYKSPIETFQMVSTLDIFRPFF